MHARCIGGTKRILFFTVVSTVIRKRSQFSSVERGSPKPNAVGSNPTERDSVLVVLGQNLYGKKEEQSENLTSCGLKKGGGQKNKVLINNYN